MRHHEHERDRREGAEPEALPVQRPRPIHNVLALQRSAGNQAVAAMLSRQPVAEETRGGGSEKAAAVGKATLTGIGAIPILSFNMATGGTGKGKTPTSDYSFSSSVGPHSSKLQEALLQGKVIDAEVEVKSFKVKLLKAMLVSYSTSSGEGELTETWTLSADSIRVGEDSDGGGGRGGGGGSWDLGGATGG